MTQVVLLDVNSRLNHYFESEQYDETRRESILTIVDNFITSSNLDVVQNAVKTHLDILTVAQIPAMIKLIVNTVAAIKTDTALSSGDMKYFIYAILLVIITGSGLPFFTALSPDLFETLFDGAYDLLMVTPVILQAAKTTVKACCR